MLGLLFALGTATQVGSTLMQGWMADYESRARQRLAERNAQIAERNAKARLEKARFDSHRAARVGEAVMGGLTAQLGASGARIDVGAPMSLLAEQAGEFELEQTLIFAEAEDEARQMRDEATMLRYGGEMARRQGKNARRASLFTAFGQATYGMAMQKALFGQPDTKDDKKDTVGADDSAEGTGRQTLGRALNMIGTPIRIGGQVFASLQTQSGNVIGFLAGRNLSSKGRRPSIWAGTNKSSSTSPGTTAA